MTDFQVGDRVSVEGVVTQLWPDAKPKPMALVSMDRESYDIPADYWIQDQALTLVERPKRKLRVGSVWECADAEMPNVRYTVVAPDMFVFTHQHGPTFMRRDITSIDTHPQCWREVPVEELEREAR